ncbi:hypothetical protein E2C01_050521 [Portunus trituberculatus]|uniref:Uncharacterized protein n=1 Tax=Portunus trituberculatus TaxID=210409 RepID=A0A5B7GGC9_PORTR|nr:hypothetical protein [Portunus trituberculatus]
MTGDGMESQVNPRAGEGQRPELRQDLASCETKDAAYFSVPVHSLVAHFPFHSASPHPPLLSNVPSTPMTKHSDP